MRALKILVRGRKDASAVRHAVERIMRDPYVIVESLGGVRNSTLCRAAEDAAEPLSIVLLDRSAPPDCIIEKPLVETVHVRASKIRNMTLQSIVSAISLGRAGLRVRYSWRGSAPALGAYLGSPLEGEPIEPEGDSFILRGRGLDLLVSLTGAERAPSKGRAGLLIKAGGGLHYLYTERHPSLVVRFPRAGRKPEVIAQGSPVTGFSESELVSNSVDVLHLLEDLSLGILQGSGVRRAIVPLSGGKDSAVALVLASLVFGPENIVAVYVDTGIDFPENREYAEYIASRLGVELRIEHADVDKGLLLERLPLPTARNRWCTGRKLEALRRVISRLRTRGFEALITGDRDAESSRRSMRPPLRIDNSAGLLVAAPLKYWSGAHVEAYLLMKGFRLNHLYNLGFVRTGCYLCFALRPSWEIRILENYGYFRELQKIKPEQAPLIERFLAAVGGHDGRGGEVQTNN